MQHYCLSLSSSSATTMPAPERTLFVTLAAQAMSSVGFSVSILAWLWLTLVPPTKPELVEPILVDKKARRRSAPATLQSHRRDSDSPSVASGDVQSSPISSLRTRRVYFVDSPAPSPSRPTNQIERSSNDFSADLLDKPLQYSPTEISPSSSSSTLVHTYTAIPPQTLETCRESAIESDSSNSSPRPSLSLSRPFLKASNRTRRSSGTSVPDVPPIVTGPSADTKQRRTSGGFIPTWGFRRASGSKNAPSSSTTTTTSSDAPGSSSTTSCASPVVVPASYFTRKTARRVSTPVPRTQPYAYPYYAQPPTEDESYVAYLRNLPQFGTDAIARSPVASDSEEKEKEPPLPDQRGRNRKINDMAQAALGLGRRPPPQRSASESWAAGKELRL
ncbi:hypothetical protein B0H19DRAFT_1128376 [Mycena capillaripes]|nr:hypothetical protein B0H19DRAFT_1128376 [Mycena capillaripes]